MLSLALLIGIIPFSAVLAAGATTLSLIADKTSAVPGETINYTVSIGAVEHLMGAEFELIVPTGLEYVENSGKVADNLKTTLGAAAADWTESTKMFTVYGEGDYSNTADTILFTFACKIAANAESGDVVPVLANVVLSDTGYNEISTQVVTGNGVVSVVIPVTGVALNKETVSLDTGANNTVTLVATVDPNKATDKTVTWKSSDETVATVDNGVVTAIKHGTTTITVKTVDGGFTDVCVVTVTCAHTAKTPTAAKTANCQEGGWDAYYTCDGCGQLFAADGTTMISAVPITGKNESNHTNVQPFAADTATCVHMGNDAYEKCVDCGVVTSGSDTKYYGEHNYGTLHPAQTEIHTPTELKAAIAAFYQCSVCNKYFDENKTETTLGALTGTTPSHSYSDWVNTDADQHWKECGCGNKIEVADHNYDNTCDTTCNTCGHVRAITHTWSNTWSTDGTNHWKECTVCRSARTEEGTHTGGTATCQAKKECTVCHLTYGNFAGCDYIENHGAQYRVSDATCVAKAVYKKSCSVCGTAHATETFEYGTVNAENHVGGTYVDGQRETDCVTPGYSGDIKCNSCREIITQGSDLPLGDHVPASVWSTDPTHHWKDCQTIGCGNLIDKAEHSGGTATCVNKAVCATCRVEYGSVDANNHAGETEIKNAKPADCDEPGYTGDTWCKDCNTKIKDGEPIPAGHKTTEVPASPATHEAAGNIKYYTCSGCSLLFADAEATSEIKAEDTVITKGEHSYDDTYATDAKNHWKECECGNKIEITEHTFGDWTVTKESTTSEKGSKEKTCSVCGHKLTEELPLVEKTNADTNSPQTGDNGHFFMWIMFIMISACGIVLTVINNKKRAR